MRKKILFAITKSVWGGAQRYTYDIASHLPSDSFEPLVVTGGTGPLVTKLRSASIRVIQIPEFERNINLAKDIWGFMKLIRIFYIEKPHVIHLNSSKIGGIGAVAGFIANRLLPPKSRSKIIFTAHGWAWDEPRPRWEKRFIVLTTRLAAYFQNAIIILSRRDLATALAHAIPQKKLIAIPLGIPEPELQSLLGPLDAQKELSEKIGITFQRPLFGTIAELTRNKGLPYLIQALHLVKQKTSRFACVIIGGGEEEAQLKRLVNENGLAHNIFFTGFLPNAPRYLKAFDFFVLPSIKEGLPYALLEALGARIPIISTRVGGIPDIVDHGKNGILVDPRNPKQLADAIYTMISSSDIRTECIRNADEKLKAFSFQRMLQQTITLYFS